ncbi:outer membrane protein assembly factor [Algoriphagus halophytocola]|uniref:Outer membrane protein assembly factor n=1 Tax=Algoriphagus halophytocola TaxID=2991499 RepID=A0ABY6MLT6_9BACT|nr:MULTISPECIES: outer membrane protein assembly factor [unclassified Algoriphagus]UZD24618.1 outer membrane protein assembly factor [Algoriphagus sp. TR-M5]WBL41986.1 outer membrane protein assembly factor [Algoriphagus sp. TR-M9]
MIFRRKAILVLLGICVSTVLFAQQKESSTDSTQVENKVDFNVMPFLSYNRNLKFMLGAIPMGMYRLDKNDTISPKSLSGLSAVYTTNGSYFLALFNKLYLKEDTWRIQLFALNGDQNSQFFMDDFEGPGFYDYGTKTSVVSAGVQRKIIPNLFLGLTYTYAHYYTEYEDDVQPPSTTETNGLQLNALFDSRDAVYYPTGGNKIRLRWIAFPEWFGNDVNANKILSEYNKFISMSNGADVLALRFSGKFGLGDIAFEQQVTIGGNDIRGYSEGKYRGDGLVALQGEYRYNFGERMGLVGFAGLATIYGSDTESFNWGFYPGAGVGYRYRAFKTVKFNIGLDAAVGKDDWGIYFRIGEAF